LLTEFDNDTVEMPVIQILCILYLEHLKSISSASVKYVDWVRFWMKSSHADDMRGVLETKIIKCDD
jgi:hypothetical protein